MVVEDCVCLPFLDEVVVIKQKQTLLFLWVFALFMLAVTLYQLSLSLLYMDNYYRILFIFTLYILIYFIFVFVYCFCISCIYVYFYYFCNAAYKDHLNYWFWFRTNTTGVSLSEYLFNKHNVSKFYTKESKINGIIGTPELVKFSS